MRVLQINAVNKKGSTGRNTWELHTELQRRGIDSYIAVGDYVSKNDNNCYQIGSPFDWKMHAFCSRFFGLQGYYSKKSTRDLLHYIDKIKPNIVHLGNYHSNYLNYKMLFDYLADNKISTVITLHDCFPYTGKCTHYSSIGCYKWKDGCYECPKLKDDIPSWFFDQTNKMWKDKRNYYSKLSKLALIGVSDWIVNEAKQASIDHAIYKRIYNWVDTEVFNYVGDKVVQEQKTNLLLFDKKIILAVASFWNSSKGIDDIIELSKVIKKDQVIVLIGSIKYKTLPSNIIHINRTDNIDELVTYYSMADVFIQLSKEESFGKVVAEALSCGTPVVTNCNTANPELVNKDCGIIVSTSNVDSINNAIQSIINNKDKYKCKCRQFAIDSFSLKTCVDSYVEIYKELL